MEPKFDRIYAAFDGRNRASLPALSQALLARQQEMWPQLRAGYAAFEARLERPLEADGLSVMLQCNPQRIVSTQADVTPGAIQARACFLCPANLPARQQAILYRRQFLVLCNPFPIVARHFTIAHREHRPQELRTALTTFLQLARDFGPDYTVLYNGPESGASAPDHLHFQALPQAALPVLNEKGGQVTKVRDRNGVSVFKKRDGARTALLVEGRDAQAITAFIKVLIRVMQRVQPAPPGPREPGRQNEPQRPATPLPQVDPPPQMEPMMNLFGLYAEGMWRVLIFPRQKHRPAAYYKSGPDQITVSPGAMDMGGVLVLPREEDYRRLDAALLRGIFEEISLGEASLAAIVAAL